MNRLEEMILRRALKPEVKKPDDHTVTLRFASFNLMPKRAVGFFDYLTEVMCRLPGVTEADVDAASGGLMIHYDKTTPEKIVTWFERVSDAGVRYLSKHSSELDSKNDTTIRQEMDAVLSTLTMP